MILTHGPAAFFSELEDSEVAPHLHPEFCPPNPLFPNPAGQAGLANLCYLPPEVQRQKISAITELFQHQYGHQPLSFRAGRFAISRTTLQILAEHGYLIDTSITPGIRWFDHTRMTPIDFRFKPRYPHFPFARHHQSQWQRFLEVPVSIAGYWPFPRTWLRPRWCDNMITTAQRILHSQILKKKKILNIMFHNVDACAGCSPHCRDQSQEEDFLHQLDQFLNWCKENDAIFMTLNQLHQELACASSS